MSTYYVDRDITILPGARFIIREGTSLEFENGLGMLVHGELKAEGSENRHIHFKLKNESTYTNNSRVQLVGGASPYEGRVEVWPEDGDTWGTVCNLVSMVRKGVFRAVIN